MSERKDRRRVAQELAKSGPLKLKDPELWQSWVAANTDSYGKGVMDYAERWARLMQRRIERGENLDHCAEQTSHDADTEGITGFMYGCAVGMLAQAWEYGEQLRRWHNLKTQIGTEGEEANRSGGTLNPALLNVGRTS